MLKYLLLFLCILLVFSCTDHLKEFEALQIMQTTNDRHERSGSQEINEGFTCILIVQEQASFPGGMKAWVKHLRKHLKPPTYPCKSGKVHVSFTVLKSGTIDSVQIVKGLCEQVNLNTIEVIKKSGIWQPACKNGQPINSRVFIPINVRYK